MYAKYWNLNRRPFTTAFHPEMVFHRKAAAELLISLAMIARAAPETIWLIGAPGSGKTTLLKSLRESVEQEVRFKLLFGNLIRGQSQFIEQIEPHRKEPWVVLHRSTVPVLEGYFRDDPGADRPLLIAIDDVDKIKSEPVVWECLSFYGLSEDRGWPLSVIFTGTHIPEAMEPYHHRPARVLDLPSPNPEELRAIIEHRLALSGANKEIFSPPAINKLIDLSQRDLRKLLLLCDLSMQIAYVSTQQHIGEEIITERVEPYARTYFANAEEEAATGPDEGVKIVEEARVEPAAAVEEAPPGRHLVVVSDTDQAEEEEAEETPEATEESEELDRKIDELIAEKPEPEPQAPSPQAAPVEEEKAQDIEQPADSGEAPIEVREPMPSEEAMEAEPPGVVGSSSLLHRAELQSYKLASLGTAPELFVSSEGEEDAAEEGSEQDFSQDWPAKKLYEAATELIRGVLQRLRQEEFVDLSPVRELSKAMIAGTEKDDGLIKLTLIDDGKTDLDIHLVNVAILATCCGRRLGLVPNDLVSLCETSLVHDVGHLHCGEDLLHSGNRFDRQDYRAIKQHPQVGSDLIRNNTNGSELMATIISQEHERDDGLGYPNYLKGNEIHLFAKIIGFCDVFEALTHSRAHRKALKPIAALGEVNALRRSRTTARIFAALQGVVQAATG